jgi:hypothetical protein
MIARRKKTLTLKEFYKEYVGHISNTLPEYQRITSMELEVLTEFWIMSGALAEVGRFSTLSKRYIREDVFKFKTYSGLENYITKLLKKGYIQNKEGEKIISPAFNLPKEKVKESGVFSLRYDYTIV